MTAQPNQSLANGLACLQALSAAEGPLGSREIARQLGMEHTRVNRLLGTLATLGLAERTAERKYQPGPGVHVLAAQALRGSGLLQAAMPSIGELVGEGHHIALGVLWRASVCYVFYGAPGRPLVEGIAGHELFPAGQSSIGLVLLSAQSTTLEGVTRATLAGIRRQGYALTTGPGGFGSLAVAVGEPPVAGLARIGQPTTAELPRLVERLRAAAQAIGERLAARASRAAAPA